MNRLFIILLFLLIPTIVKPQTSPKYHLKDIQSFRMFVMDLPTEIEEMGLRNDSIRTVVKQQLKQSGISLSDYTYTPFIYIEVNTYNDKRFSVYPFNISLSVIHIVELGDKSTWGIIYSVNFVTMTSDVNEIHVGIRDVVNTFIRDYKEVNPNTIPID